MVDFKFRTTTGKENTRKCQQFFTPLSLPCIIGAGVQLRALVQAGGGPGGGVRRDPAADHIRHGRLQRHHLRLRADGLWQDVHHGGTIPRATFIQGFSQGYLGTL